jgi:hypothetical protein
MTPRASSTSRSRGEERPRTENCSPGDLLLSRAFCRAHSLVNRRIAASPLRELRGDVASQTRQVPALARA